MVAKAQRILPRYLAQVKTDCLLTQRLPKRFAERLRALEALRHPDGTPVYRVEETKPLLGSRAPRMEAERPKQRRWNGVDDPISHCLAGNSLLLTGLPGTGKTHLARTIVARLREQGETVHLVSKTHCSAQNLGLGAQTADHWVRRNVRGGSAQKLDWLVVEEITQLDMALWADLACVGLNADVKFLLLGDFRQLPAVLDSWAGRPISAPLEHSQLIRDLAGGHRHELTENMRSDPGIFNFVKWLRVGEEACPGAGQGEAEGALLYCLRRATLHLLRALPRLVQEALHVTGPADDLRRRLRRATHLLSGVLGQLRAESLRGCEPRGPCAYEVRCRLRAVCSAAQAVRDGGRPLPVAGQRAGLGVSRKVVLAEAVSSLVPPRKAHVLVRGLCGSAEAFLGNCLQGRVLQGPGVGVLAGLQKIVQVEVACDERGGLAVRLVQG